MSEKLKTNTEAYEKYIVIGFFPNGASEVKFYPEVDITKPCPPVEGMFTERHYKFMLRAVKAAFGRYRRTLPAVRRLSDKAEKGKKQGVPVTVSA